MRKCKAPGAERGARTAIHGSRDLLTFGGEDGALRPSEQVAAAATCRDHNGGRMSTADGSEIGEMIRVRGLVQGVGFRPAVWRLAQARGLRGSVANDGEGVSIHIGGLPAALADFVVSLLADPPRLSRIERVERVAAPMPPELGFRIASSQATTVRTGVVPDAAT